jgi:hypothetical protein
LLLDFSSIFVFFSPLFTETQYGALADENWISNFLDRQKPFF